MKKVFPKAIITLSTLLFILIGCSKDDDSTPLSSSKLFTSFQFLATNNDDLTEDITNLVINKTEKSITATLPYGSDITNLTPNIVVSTGATVNPTGAQDFSNPVTYTITAEDKSKVSYVVTINIALNNEKQINSFVLLADDNTALNEDITATINEDEKTITATVPYGTDVTALIPSIELSEEATINPTETQDFTEPVTYTVTAEDETTVTYEVSVNITANDEKLITAFQFTKAKNQSLSEDIFAIINEDEKTIMATLPYGVDFTNLTPSIEISEGATISPEGAQDFSKSVTYTITAHDGTKDIYVVNTQLSQRGVLLAIYNSSPSNYNFNWDITSTDIGSWKGVTIDSNGNVTQLELKNTNINNIPTEIEQLKSLTHLSLHGSYYLTSIPSEIGKLTNLIELNLSASNITSLPTEIGQLTNLTKLYLNYTEITALPNEIINLINLTELHISGNDLISIPEQILQLTSLTKLVLQSCGLISIPAEIELLTNLTELNLSYNALTHIPNEIGKLTNLTNLRLDFNVLASIPSDIGNLTNLIKFTLNRNNLTSLPAEIGKLTKLPELSLYLNNLTSIPAEIGKLQSLNRLEISRNNLTSIPSEIGQLNNLTELILYNNSLTTLPAEIGDLKNLTTLSLTGNQLTSIPTNIGGLTTLSLLGLGKNELTSIPIEIGQLTNLTRLLLNENNLTSIPVEFSNLITLERLYLQDNNLTTIPQAVCDLNINDLRIDEGVTCE